MIIFGIVTKGSLAYEPERKISIDSFVVVQRHEAQIVETEKGANDEDPDDAESPYRFGNVFLDSRFNRVPRIVRLGWMALNALT